MKICLLGCRGHWPYVFQSLPQLSGIYISAVCSGCQDSPKPLLEACQKHGFKAKVYNDYIEMLEREQPRLVCVAGPFERHAEMCMQALKREVSVFCEKPVALKLDELEQIELTLKASKAKLASMMAMRYEPAFYSAYKLKQDGAIGKVKLIKAQKSYKLGKRPEYYKKRQTHGGLIPWVGSHAIDLIMFFAKRRFQSVWANHSSSDNRGHGELECAAQCQFLLEDEIMASASIDYLRPETAATHGDDRIRVAGTQGIIEVRDGKVLLDDCNGCREVPLQNPKRKIFADFVMELRGDAHSLLEPGHSIALARACLVARQSADCGRLLHF